MSKLFLKNIKKGTVVRIKVGAAVIDGYDKTMSYWHSKYKDYLFNVVDNRDFTSYALTKTIINEDGTILTLIKKTNMHNLEMVNK